MSLSPPILAPRTHPLRRYSVSASVGRKPRVRLLRFIKTSTAPRSSEVSLKDSTVKSFIVIIRCLGLFPIVASCAYQDRMGMLVLAPPLLYYEWRKIVICHSTRTKVQIIKP